MNESVETVSFAWRDFCDTEVSWKSLKKIKSLNLKGGENKRMDNAPRIVRYAWYFLPLIPLYYIVFHIQPIIDFTVKVFILHNK